MPAYDSKVIYTFAERLYRQAASIVAVYTLLGVLVGAAVYLTAVDPKIAGVAAVVFGAIGYSLGNQRAFVLRLQAQTALCQVQIEENTRGVRGGALPTSAQVGVGAR